MQTLASDCDIVCMHACSMFMCMFQPLCVHTVVRLLLRNCMLAFMLCVCIYLFVCVSVCVSWRGYLDCFEARLIKATFNLFGVMHS